METKQAVKMVLLILCLIYLYLSLKEKDPEERRYYNTIAMIYHAAFMVTYAI